MNRRRHPLPDTRPSWRDPDMPVLLPCKDQTTGQPYLREYTSDRAQYAFSVRMQMGNALPWQIDPTYNLRRKGRL
jgi:hypothetical protein